MKVSYKQKIEVLEMFMFTSMSREAISEKTGVTIDAISGIVYTYHKNDDCVIVKSKINNGTKIMVKDFKKRFRNKNVVTRLDIRLEFDCTHKMCTSLTSRLLKKGVVIKWPKGFKIVKK